MLTQYSLGKDNPDLVQKFFPFVKNLKANIFHDVSKTSGNFLVSTIYPKAIYLQPHQVLLVFAVLGQSSFVSEQEAGLSPCIVWTWLSHYRWKGNSKTRSVQSKQVLYFSFFGEQGQTPSSLLPASLRDLSPHLKKPIPLFPCVDYRFSQRMGEQSVQGSNFATHPSWSKYSLTPAPALSVPT